MKRRYSSTYSSSDDELLINKRRVTTKNELYKRRVDTCEFCDNVFYNKYDMMVHHAKHIIIPLIRLNVYTCPKCYFCCTSSTSLEQHELKNHITITNGKDFMPELINSIMKKEPCMIVVKEQFETNDEDTREHDIKEEDINEEEDTKEEILQSFVVRQPITLLTKESFVIQKQMYDGKLESDSKLLESFVDKEAITLLKPLDINDEIINISDSDSDDFDTETRHDLSSNENNSIENIRTERIKDRILFEEDDGDIENFNGELNLNNKSNISSLASNVKKNTIILGRYPCDETQYKSIHYAELTKPGIFNCKPCSKSFPNRYNLIIHETNHMRFKKRLPFLCRMCDWYVASNRWTYKDHLSKHHPDTTAPRTAPSRCRKCNLNYIFYYKHMMNYHQTYICRTINCKLTFDNQEEYIEHRKVHGKPGPDISRSIKNNIDNGENNQSFGEASNCYQSSLVKVCELCYTFFKSKANVQYKYFGTVNEIGVRQHCMRCAKKFFELNVINVRVKKRVNPNVRKKVTNQERLKIVQQRLKKLKFLNKF